MPIPWAAIGAAGTFASGMGSLVSGISSAFGGSDDSTSAARHMMQHQHDKYIVPDLLFADSRKVSSLKAAGLNPAIAYGGYGSGVSSPAPPGYSPDYTSNRENSLTNRINSAREGLLAMAQVAKLKADTEASESVADLNRATAIRTGVQTQIDTSNAGLASISLDKEKFLRDKFDSFDVAGRELSARKGHAVLDLLQTNRMDTALWAADRLAKSLGFANAAAGMESFKFRSAFQDLVMQQFAMPKASAEHDFYLSTFGKSIAPYLNSAESISRTVRPFKR